MFIVDAENLQLLDRKKRLPIDIQWIDRSLQEVVVCSTKGFVGGKTFLATLVIKIRFAFD